jgi:hypothetical protein
MDKIIDTELCEMTQKILTLIKVYHDDLEVGDNITNFALTALCICISQILSWQKSLSKEQTEENFIRIMELIMINYKLSRENIDE